VMDRRCILIGAAVIMLFAMTHDLPAATISDIYVQRNEGITHVIINSDGSPEYTYKINDKPPAVVITVHAILVMGNKEYSIIRGGITSISTTRGNDDLSYITVNFQNKTTCSFSEGNGQIIITLQPENNEASNKQKVDTTVTILHMKQTDYNKYLYWDSDSVIIKVDYEMFVDALKKERWLYGNDMKKALDHFCEQEGQRINIDILKSSEPNTTEDYYKSKPNFYGECFYIIAQLMIDGNAAVFRKSNDCYSDTVICKSIRDTRIRSFSRYFNFPNGYSFFKLSYGQLQIH
jgi:hypothetical protein